MKTIGRLIGHPRPVLSMPPTVAYYAALAAGKVLGDVVITRDEIQGLMEGLLYVDAPSAGTTRLTTWVAEHKSSLGIRYASELARR